jgi:hypothetical protein
MDRPTGIIRTLPSLYADNKNVGFRRYIASLHDLQRNDVPFYIALAQKPTIEVLHIYLLIEGRIRVRLNISGFIPGGDEAPVQCWDDEFRQPKWWVECSGPVSRPPQRYIKMRGFQGFRYTEDLW